MMQQSSKPNRTDVLGPDGLFDHLDIDRKESIFILHLISF